MINKSIIRVCLFCTLLLIVCMSCVGDQLAVEDMKVEYAETPLGVDVANPRFSWRMECTSLERGINQTAYQIVVTDDHGKIVWDSEKVESDVSLNIKYSGETLIPATRYIWKVNVWDNKDRLIKGESWFETSLLCKDDIVGWNDAQWIGGGDDDMVLYSHYLPVFKLNFSFILSENAKSKKIAFIYGANDERLMNRYKNLYHLSNAKDRSYIKVEFDLSPLDLGKSALAKIYRIGYHINDCDTLPYAEFNIPMKLVNRNNLYSEHIFTLYSNLGFTRLYKANVNIGEVNLNPLGLGGDFIAFPVVGDIGYSVPSVDDIVCAKIDICNFRSPQNKILGDSLDIDRMRHSTNGYYIENPSCNSMPMLRTEFSVPTSSIKKARLYATSRGIYEMYFNGKRVGNDYFNPGITQYNKTHLYQIYDVTDLVVEGQNALGAILAEGWWSGGATYTGDHWNYFGDRQSLLAQLVITYKDGTKQVVTTNPETWKYYKSGPIVYGSFFQGEVYDATKEAAIEGWANSGYDDSAWGKAQLISLEGNVSSLMERNNPRVDDYSEYQLLSQYGQTVKAVKKLTAVSMEEVRPGVFVYDMGQNMVGVPEIFLNGMKAGKKINLRFAEVKYPDLPRYAGNEGMVMLENIRAAMAQDIYITKGGKETISPRFTYHGYRYVEITGIDEALPLEAVKGVVLSSIDELSSHYETSNEKVNKLWNNIVWSTYSNFLSIPTDCPQRNERLGWSGDISVFSRTATYLSNVSQFLRRHLRAMRDVQREDGRFPDVAPLGGGFGGILWGSAGITVAWECYQQYNDKALLEEHYDAMCEYIDYILSKNIDSQTNVIVQEKVFGNLGDWLGPEDKKNDKTLMWEAYFLYDLDIMFKIATLLDKPSDAARYKKLYEERLSFFRNTYISSENAKTISSGADGPFKGEEVDIQTSYVRPLVFHLIPDSLKLDFSANLAHSIDRLNIADDGKTYPPYSLMTGFIGTAWINIALSDNGYNDIAYTLLQQTSYPSWLYSVEQGATTIWERLNSYTHIDGFGDNNRMNSFNHYSFGAVGAWMYSYSLGIQRDEDNPGFKKIILSPQIDPTGKMTYAKGYYDSMYGRIESEWKVEGNHVNYHFAIPANTSALLVLPAKSLSKIKESGRDVHKSIGIEVIKVENKDIIFKLQSGKYNFQVNIE